MNKSVNASLFEEASNEVVKSYSDAETFIDDTLYHLCPAEREEFAELISSFGLSANFNESAAYTIQEHPKVVKRVVELMLKIGNYHTLGVVKHMNENGLEDAA